MLQKLGELKAEIEYEKEQLTAMKTAVRKNEELCKFKSRRPCPNSEYFQTQYENYYQVLQEQQAHCLADQGI